MSEDAQDRFSKNAILARFRAARKARDGEVVWLAWGLDTLAVFVLIAFGWTFIAVLTFVAARFAARVPTLIGWGFLAALAGFIVFPMLFLFFTTP